MTAAARNLYASTVPAIEIAGQRHFSVQRDLLDLQVSADRLGPRHLRLRLTATTPGAMASEGASLYLDGQIFDFGKEIKVKVGPAGAQALVFEGRISRIEAQLRQGEPMAVEIQAEDRLFDLATTRHTQSHEEANLADLVRAVAGRHGLTPDISIEGPRLALVQQWNETDLAFLATRAEELDADLWVEEGRLCLAPRADRRPNEMVLHPGAELHSLQLCADLGAQRSEVSMGGYDMAQRQAVLESAGAAEVAALTRGGRSGLDVLDQAFGARSGGRRLQAVTGSEEARALAKAALLSRARRFVTVRGQASVLPELTIGTRLRFDGIGGMFAGGGYGVCELAHGFDRRDGATTRFRAERATLDGGE